MASPPNGHEFKQTPGDSEGQRSLVFCSPRGGKGSDITEELNNHHPLPLAETNDTTSVLSPWCPSLPQAEVTLTENWAHIHFLSLYCIPLATCLPPGAGPPCTFVAASPAPSTGPESLTNVD